MLCFFEGKMYGVYIELMVMDAGDDLLEEFLKVELTKRSMSLRTYLRVAASAEAGEVKQSTITE